MAKLSPPSSPLDPKKINFPFKIDLFTEDNTTVFHSILFVQSETHTISLSKLLEEIKQGKTFFKEFFKNVFQSKND